MASIDEKDVLDGDALNELYRWIDAVPLSRPKKNIARDFSDGVSVAEIIHHYLPRAVEMHNYAVASATGQKRINWNTLNRKVFGKMNIKLSDLTLSNVVECKPGAIEQVLWDLRRKIQENVTTSTDPKRELTFSKSRTGNGFRVGGAPSVKNLPPQKGTPSGAHFYQGSTRSVTQWTHESFNPRQLKSKPNLATSTPVGNENKVQAKGSFTITSVNRQPSSYKTVGASRESRNFLEMSAKEESIPKQTSLLLDQDDIPSQIVFRGHKMINVEMLETKNKEIKDLENANKQLAIKIDRLERLVNIKEDRIVDLSHELSNLRSLYEHSTSNILKTQVADKSDANNNEDD